MMRLAVVALLVAASAVTASGLEVWDQVVLNEVYYYVPGFDAHNEYFEILNAGGMTAYLDGAIVTDEGQDGKPEGVFKFPGRPGDTEIPIEPGRYMIIAIDAVEGEVTPDLTIADWELWHPGDDNDNPDVPNLVLCSGADADMALANCGDGLLIATGEDTTAAVDWSTIVDGVNWGDVTDPVPISWLVWVDPEYAPLVPQGNCLGRCPVGIDQNVSSAADWFMMIPSPGELNIPSHPGDCTTSVRGATWGLLKALYR